MTKEPDTSGWVLRFIEGETFKMTPVAPLIRRYPSAAPTPRSTTYCECHGVYQDCGYQDRCR